MPKVITDYSKTIIYKIQHQENPELLYIGSTTNFAKRKSEHKRVCNSETDRKHNLKLYTTIRDNGGWECFRMLEMKKFPCENRTEAHQEEDRVYLDMKANMNDRRPHRNKKQYMLDNVDKKAEYDRVYRQVNETKRNEQKKKHYRDNFERISKRGKEKVLCECGNSVTRSSLFAHKKSKRHTELMFNLHKCSSSQ